MYCHNCGQRNPESRVLCCTCRAVLPRATEQDTTAALDALGEGTSDNVVLLRAFDPGDLGDVTAVLAVRRGPEVGQRFLLTGTPVLFGRDPSCDVVLANVSVSRKHARIRRERGCFRITDLGSLNGTYVNRVRVEDAELQSGDEVQIGTFRLLFVERLPKG